jgi:hypothetical protein
MHDVANYTNESDYPIGFFLKFMIVSKYCVIAGLFLSLIISIGG